MKPYCVDVWIISLLEMLANVYLGSVRAHLPDFWRHVLGGISAAWASCRGGAGLAASYKRKLSESEYNSKYINN